jgi:hypothetical protein
MRPLLLVLATLAFICSPSVVQANAPAPSPTDTTAHAPQAAARSSAVAEPPATTLSSSRRCRRNPLGCIYDAIIEGILAPIVAPVIEHVFSEVRVSGAVAERSDFGVRLGRTFSYEATRGPLVFPYVAIGVRFQQNDPDFSRFFGSPTTFLETTVGARTNLETWHPAPAAWVERLHITTEAQWLRNRSRADQLWVEVAPGVDLSQSTPIVRLFLSASVPVTGALRPTVRPGVGVEMRW